ncbi:hypothetical protein OAE39_02915, partial [Akkermansiaceae bacterium]|nr:hypothetical protein [Akkermansiaceae bacterium]
MKAPLGPLGQAIDFNWATDATGAAIPQSDGFTVSFDPTPPGTENPDWGWLRRWHAVSRTTLNYV